ncbi:hypothetical protein PRZ48_015160 [Zasmidium cellare]|uniref:Uncharacterized protein n=1 Tax=Zasmidium cellare TaxID=395010 RepID=A0ABR0DXT8_ZASCE|nr:hypothetical protein PRZ48_015160 [Zasmidium cellare]
MSTHRRTPGPDTDLRGPSLANELRARAGGRYMTVHDKDREGNPRTRILDLDDYKTVNRFFLGPYIPTANKTRRYKESLKGPNYMRINTDNIPPPSIVYPGPDDPEYLDGLDWDVDEDNLPKYTQAEKRQMILAGAALVLILSLVLGAVVQLKDDPRSPWEAARSNVAEWVWGVIEYFRSLFAWVFSSRRGVAEYDG